MAPRLSAVVLLFTIFYAAKSVTALKISYACGPKDTKFMAVQFVDDKNEGFNAIGTYGYNSTHSATCSVQGAAGHDSKVSLIINEKDFVKCNFDVQGHKVTANITVRTNATYLDRTNSRLFTLSCDFSKERTQQVIFGLSTYKECKTGEFYCGEKAKCLNSNNRCAGKGFAGERCINVNNEEVGCDANKNGEYNIQVYKKFGSLNTDWIEYRGFSYFLKDDLSTEENPSFPPLVVKYREARVKYTSPGASTCSYDTVGQFNADFNTLMTRKKTEGISCLDYFKGVLAVLLDKCKDMKSKATTTPKRREYVHEMCLKDSSKGSSECEWSVFSSAGDLRSHVTLVVASFAVGLVYSLTGN